MIQSSKYKHNNMIKIVSFIESIFFLWQVNFYKRFIFLKSTANVSSQ